MASLARFVSGWTDSRSNATDITSDPLSVLDSVLEEPNLWGRSNLALFTQRANRSS